MAIPKRHPDIIAARAAYDVAARNLADTLARVQAECLHEVVCEAPYKPSEFGSPSLPRRMCLTCGYEEEAWSWGPYSSLADRDTNIPTKLRTDFVLHVSREDFWKLRP